MADIIQNEPIVETLSLSSLISERESLGELSTYNVHVYDSTGTVFLEDIKELSNFSFTI